MRRDQAGLVGLFLGALKGVLRELPESATGFRVDPGPAGYVMVQLMGPEGPLVACTVAQRMAPPGDGRQLTIDDALRARSPKQAVADVPSPLAKAPPAPIDVPALAEATPDVELEEQVRLWISEAEWDGLDGKTRTELEGPYPWGHPGSKGLYPGWQGRDGWVTALVPRNNTRALRFIFTLAAECRITVCEGPEAPTRAQEVALPVRIKRSDWQKHRDGLLDRRGLALGGLWGPDGADRVSLLFPDELRAVQKYCTEQGLELRVDAPPGGAP